MSKHTNLGRIAIPVGSYEKNGATKKRYRNIGELMETTEDDGSRHHWLKLNLDIFHASLFALTGVARKKGDDTVIATVFSDDKKPGAEAAPAEPEPY